MEEIVVWSIAFIAALTVLIVLWIGPGGLGLLKVFRFNRVRLAELERVCDAAGDPKTKNALQAVIDPCRALHFRWILLEEDLNIGAHTRRQVEAVAVACHPGSAHPTGEARIGKLLSAFIEAKDTALGLTQIPGMRSLTRFRLRHAAVVAGAWKKKRAWEQSPVGKAVARFKVIPVLRWIYFSLRFMDIGFWAVRMGRYLMYDLAFKILLVRWYLMVGELALKVYNEDDSADALPGEDLFSELEDLPAQEVPTDLPEPVRAIADESRKHILYNIGTLDQHEVTAVYTQLVRSIARHHHPRSNEPVQEARLYDLIQGVSRFADWVGSIQSRPVFNKLLGLRVSHCLMVKDAADYLKDSQTMGWFKKYKMGEALKYSNLLYKLVVKRHPGVLLKDVAWTVAREGCKRWLWTGLHGKIALEAHVIYREKNNP
ncbi:hypothetical protein UZ36_05915 [Candidatus Nitromaritima sp. SCGC AAA799-C22]|nr:hypothetical protein UZ36_05915 [Candidatus Nitromaritima sp. SCGC AAA799-C22]